MQFFLDCNRDVKTIPIVHGSQLQMFMDFGPAVVDSFIVLHGYNHLTSISELFHSLGINDIFWKTCLLSQMTQLHFR